MKPLPRNPFLTVDILIEVENRIVLIERKNSPHGWAIPGGFVDYGESVEQAAIREAKEETGLQVSLSEILYVYSSPQRDPRQHIVSVVFIAKAEGKPKAADDAKSLKLASVGDWPTPMCFDHDQILNDYVQFRQTGERPKPQIG